MSRSNGHTTQEHQVTLTLMAAAPMSREALEEWTVHAEHVLEERAADVALGASAAANFAANAVEVDFVVVVATDAELYDSLSRVVRVLHEAGFEAPGKPDVPAMQVAASATQAVAVCV
jgi:precorrin-2 methylase